MLRTATQGNHLRGSGFTVRSGGVSPISSRGLRGRRGNGEGTGLGHVRGRGCSSHTSTTSPVLLFLPSLLFLHL